MNLTLHIAPVPNLLSVPPLLPIRRNFAPSSARPHLPSLLPILSTLRGLPPSNLLSVPPLLPMRRSFAPSSARPHHLPSLLPIFSTLRGSARPHHLPSLLPILSTLRGLPPSNLLSVPPLLPMRRSFAPSSARPHHLPSVLPIPSSALPSLHLRRASSLHCVLLPSRVPLHRRGRFTLSFVLLARLPFLPHLPHIRLRSRRGFMLVLPRIPNRIPCIRARFIFSFPRILSLRSGGFQVTGDPDDPHCDSQQHIVYAPCFFSPSYI
ncbi:RLORF6 [Gallid alphaherpesvirus 2]|uniref:RLORF6 n=2 Tax=Gallid alphaherpesvirus 2 TaxID=10390 RepID=G9CU88_9ALPH|nr:RLORF6 [Gallid alphaherpesvirus 2]ACF94911.1 RLORF6 [Gallid alphaherpesvirus 2]ADA83405.1 hypothetical protein [Gallid alphaherpesvirus 2]AEV54965.1 RLORF6 [Gallid herpesvirus 2 strain 814]AEV55052.1 RLORF6 [Gallid herpesvirus 2 strain 814]